MPCYQTGSAEGDARLDAEEARKELTDTTRMLCRLMTVLVEADVFKGTTFIGKVDGLQEWWRLHQEIDRQRIEKGVAKLERQRLRVAGIAKLSAAERDALGLQENPR